MNGASGNRGKLLGLLGVAAVVGARRAGLLGSISRQPLLTQAFVQATRAIDTKVGWDRLPTPLGLVVLIGIRMLLRQRNLHDTSTPGRSARVGPVSAAPVGQVSPGQVSAAPVAAERPAVARHLVARTADGTYNDLAQPTMGSAGTRFGRNVPLEHTWPEPEPALLTPNPRIVSRELLTRDTFQPATTLNVLAAAWLQFMIRDWFSHGKGDKTRAWTLRLDADDPWPERPADGSTERSMLIPRTIPDPTRSPADEGLPPTYVNTETHWWDGSQLYGSNREFQAMVRSGQDGKLRVGPGGTILEEFLVRLAEEPGWWVGLALFQTLFTLEHNAICDRLRAEYPTWSDDDLFERARLINTALLAKIHTVEWTPGIISHPTTVFAMRANWWGLEGERLYQLFGRISDSEIISGIPGSPTDHHTAPYALTEEFVAVYRMHPLIPDDFSFRSAADDGPLQERTFRELTDLKGRELLGQVSMPDLLYSFGRAHPGAVRLHNFPRFLQEFKRPDGALTDLAATDILRSRELGVPRYNQFRRLLNLRPAGSFEELTDNPVWAEELRRVYGGDVERVDLTVGMFAERLPEGFGFSDTAFRIFILMASRRLKSDRFFTTDYTPRVYTQAGMDWINDNDMSSVLLRHYPSLRPALRGVTNAFAPWNSVKA